MITPRMARAVHSGTMALSVRAPKPMTSRRITGAPRAGRRPHDGLRALREPLTPRREALLEMPPGADRAAHPVGIAATAAPEAPPVRQVPPLDDDDRRKVGRVGKLLHAPLSERQSGGFRSREAQIESQLLLFRGGVRLPAAGAGRRRSGSTSRRPESPAWRTASRIWPLRPPGRPTASPICRASGAPGGPASTATTTTSRKNLKPGDVQPWAEALRLKRVQDFRKDSPLAQLHARERAVPESSAASHASSRRRGSSSCSTSRRTARIGRSSPTAGACRKR